jgi:hypothetical protein
MEYAIAELHAVHRNNDRGCRRKTELIEVEVSVDGIADQDVVVIQDVLDTEGMVVLEHQPSNGILAQTEVGTGGTRCDVVAGRAKGWAIIVLYHIEAEAGIRLTGKQGIAQYEIGLGLDPTADRAGLVLPDIPTRIRPEKRFPGLRGRCASSTEAEQRDEQGMQGAATYHDLCGVKEKLQQDSIRPLKVLRVTAQP